MRETEKRGLFWKWGKLMYRRRIAVTILWIFLFIGLGVFALKAPGLLNDNGFTPRGSDSDQGIIQLQEKLDFPPSQLVLMYTSDTKDLTSVESQAVILDSLQGLKELPYVDSIQPVSASRVDDTLGVVAVNVLLTSDTNHATNQYPDIRSRIKAPEGMTVYVTGGPAVLNDMQKATKSDIAKSEIIGLPIALIVLLLIFGTVLGAVLPMIVGILSVTVTLGITYFIADSGVALSSFLPNIVTMLGLAVGIDYALFMVSRFREELKRRETVEEAVAMTVQMAGKSIFFSGLAVLIGLFGMLFINLSVFQSLCLGGVLVVLASLAVAVTLLPALLGIFGHRINSLRVVPARFRKQESSRFWEKIAYGVMKHPIVLVVVMAGLLIVLMLPLGQMKLGVPDAELLPPSYESRHGADLLNQTYDSRETNSIQIYAELPGAYTEEASLRELKGYEDRLRGLTGVKEVKSLFTAMNGADPEQAAAILTQPQVKGKLEEQRLAKNNAALLVVVPSSDPNSEDANQLVKDIRTLDQGKLHTLVTGGAPFRVDMLDRINSRLPALIGFVMVVTYLVLLFAFRSVILPLKAVLMNVLSLGASLGIVVSVFQNGWAADLLQVSSIGYVNAVLPVIIFCVVFGISMDYEVFLISRIMEEYEMTGDNERSTAEGLKKTGSLISSAAFILVVVVGAFIFTDIEIIKALGIGLSCAVLIDATLIRLLVVPALMKLLGRANWWAPRWLGGRHIPSGSREEG